MKPFDIFKRVVVVSAVLALMLTMPVLAQNGVVRGKVVDEAGNPIPDVAIRIEGMGVKRNYTVKTNADGDYIHIGVSIQGTYRVIAEKEGFQSDYAEGVKPGFSRDGEQGLVNFTLKSGESAKLAFEMTADEREAIKKKNEDARKRNQDLQSAFSLGVEAYNQDQYEVALENFLKASKTAPDEPNVWGNLARTQAKLRDFDGAIASYEKAITLNPEDTAFYQNVGSIYAAKGDAAKAKEYYEKAAEKAAATNPEAAGGAYYNMAVGYINAGKNADAKEALEKALSYDPNHADAHYQLALVMLGMNMIEESVGHLKKYLELDPNGQFAPVAKDLIASLK